MVDTHCCIIGTLLLERAKARLGLQQQSIIFQLFVEVI